MKRIGIVGFFFVLLLCCLSACTKNASTKTLVNNLSEEELYWYELMTETPEELSVCNSEHLSKIIDKLWSLVDENDHIRRIAKGKLEEELPNGCFHQEGIFWCVNTMDDKIELCQLLHRIDINGVSDKKGRDTLIELKEMLLRDSILAIKFYVRYNAFWEYFNYDNKEEIYRLDDGEMEKLLKKVEEMPKNKETEEYVFYEIYNQCGYDEKENRPKVGLSDYRERVKQLKKKL